MSRISVIVPVYKVELYLRRCVDSILAQTFSDFELILVDDGSPDRCGAICDEYAEKDSRVHVIHQENGGLSAARNAGIDWVFANSDNQWLTFIDSDDWVHPQMLEQLYRAVQEHAVKVSVGSYCETDGEEPWEENPVMQSKLWSVEQYYVERNVNATIAVCKLYARDCFREIRYPVGKIHEDEYVTYRILFEQEKVAVIETPMYAYYFNANSITKSAWTPKKMDSLAAIEGQIAFLKKNGFLDGYRYRAERYVRVLSWQLNLARENGYAGSMYERILHRKLKLNLLRYHNMYPFRRNECYYDQAFPKLMNIYWIIKSQINKLKRK